MLLHLGHFRADSDSETELSYITSAQYASALTTASIMARAGAPVYPAGSKEMGRDYAATVNCCSGRRDRTLHFRCHGLRQTSINLGTQHGQVLRVLYRKSVFRTLMTEQFVTDPKFMPQYDCRFGG